MATIRVSAVPSKYNSIPSIAEFFGKYGEVVGVRLRRNRAYVTYKERDGAEKALSSLDNYKGIRSVCIREYHKRKGLSDRVDAQLMDMARKIVQLEVSLDKNTKLQKRLAEELSLK